MQIGSIQHEKALGIYIKGSTMEGKRVIDLQGKSPDAIEVYLKDGKIIINVIEIMHKSKGNLQKLSSSSKSKKELYEGLGFDEVKIYQYSPEHKTFKKALKRIPIRNDYSYTCKECGAGFNNVSKFQSHIYHEHTKKNPKNKCHFKEKIQV